MNRYFRKREHKRVQQEQYMKKYSGGTRNNVKLFRDELRNQELEYAETLWGRRHKARNGGWEYWKQNYLSGKRRFAKKCSNKRIRQKYRLMANHKDHEEVTAPKCADYEKEFDYTWTIW